MKSNASDTASLAHVRRILEILAQSYPDASIVLRWTNPWELLVAVILSAQCTDVMVNKVTASLFRKYPTLDSYVSANPDEFEKDITSTGFFRNKTKNILGAARMVRNRFSGSVPRTMKDILMIPGVARKTANVVLGNAFNVVEGIAVDTHVLRLSQRLRLVPLDDIGGKYELTVVTDGQRIIDYKKDADPVKIEHELMKRIPKFMWFDLTYRLIDHGRAVCRAQRPSCGDCPLSSVCPVKRG